MNKEFIPTWLKLWLEVEDTEYEVSAANINYSFNMIPYAQVDLAVGKDVENLNRRAAVHNNQKQLARRTRAQIKMQLKGIKSPDGSRWNENIITIFDGYIHGVVPGVSVGGVGVRVALIHWLSDLNTSHAFSAFMSVSTPYDVFNAEVGGQVFNYGGSDSIPGPTLFESVTPSDAFQGDLWSNVIRRGLYFINIRTPTLIPGVDDRANQPRQIALEAMESYPDLIIRPDIRDSMNQIQACRFIRDTLFTAQGGNTMWKKIASLSRTFLFGISPLVDKVLVVPACPAYNAGEGAVEIRSNEFDLGPGRGLNFNVPRGLALTGTPKYNNILGGEGSADTSTIASKILAGFVGQYVISGSKLEDGPIDVYPAPPWIVWGQDAQKGLLGFDQEIPASIQPNSSKDRSKAEAPQEQDIDQLVKMGNAYAKALYYTYVMAYRSQQVSSRLRFDLAPGGIVKLYVKDDQSQSFDIPGFSGGEILGFVQSINYNISADPVMAETAINLTHIRYDTDIENQQFFLSEHPMYMTVFRGASLVENI